MLELGQLKSQIQGLNSRTENTRREAVQALKAHEAADWVGVSNEIVRPLVETLRHQLPKSHEAGSKPPLFRQEIATILGNIGQRSEPAIPQLMELLEEGVPNGVREAAAAALGKIGKESRVAVDQLIHVLQNTSRIALAD